MSGSIQLRGAETVAQAAMNIGGAADRVHQTYLLFEQGASIHMEELRRMTDSLIVSSSINGLAALVQMKAAQQANGLRETAALEQLLMQRGDLKPPT